MAIKHFKTAEIGFKNAIVARDFPTDDPDFDPDDHRTAPNRNTRFRW